MSNSSISTSKPSPRRRAGAPLGTTAFATIAYGINADGVVVGQYALGNGGAVHGFVAIPPDVRRD
jgi:hypothetical protein